MKVVFFNFLTTGKDIGQDEIIAIEAICVGGRHAFQCYVQPQCSIKQDATLRHGLSTENGLLLLHGHPVTKVLSPFDALLQFWTWINSNRTRSVERVVLVSHGDDDVPFLPCSLLADCMVKHGVSKSLRSCLLRITFLVDSRLMAKKELPNLKSHDMKGLLDELCSRSGRKTTKKMDGAKDCRDVVRAMADRRDLTVEAFVRTEANCRVMSFYDRVVEAEEKVAVLLN